jgi:protein TonB
MDSRPLPQSVDIPRLGLALRVTLGLVVGATVALCFAWLMHYLIQSSEMRLSAAERVRMLDFVRVKRDEVVERKDRKPERPQVSQSPEVPQTPQQSDSNSGGEQLAVQAPTVQAADIGLGRSTIGIGEGDYLPIVKVAPIYPRRALQRGITGTCVVRYTVTTAGSTRDVEVVREHCSEPMFERPSIEAAKRFRYKPRVIDGEAVEVVGVHNMFHFEELKGEGGSQ